MRQCCQGFTLLELMIVIVVIGMLLGMVSLVVAPNPLREARHEAGEVAGMILRLRERAVLNGEQYGIRFSESGYRVMQLDDREWLPMAAFHQWPANLRLHLEQDGHALALGGDQGLPQLLMLSSDENTAFTLTFTMGDRTLLSLSSDGLGEAVIDG